MKSETAVPEIICAAGEPAVAAYGAFLDGGGRNRNRRRLHWKQVERIFRWAEDRGLTLEAIDPLPSRRSRQSWPPRRRRRRRACT